MDKNYILTAVITPTTGPVLQLSSKSFSTGTTDSPANVNFLGRIVKRMKHRKSMGSFLWNRPSNTYIDAMVLDNKDGMFDAMILGDYRDAKVKLSLHDPAMDFQHAIDSGEYIIETANNPDDDTVVVVMNDKLTLIDKNTPNEYFPLTIEFVENQEKSEPIAIGTCLQVPVPMIDSVDNRYEVHQSAPIIDFGVLTDRLHPFVLGIGYTTENPIPETGGVGYNLTSPASGVITVNNLVGAAVFLNPKFGDTKFFEYFARYLCVDLGGLSLTDDIEISSAEAVDTEWDFRYGRWIPEPENMRDILEQTMIGHCGYFQQKADGKIHFDWLKAPVGGFAAIDVNRNNLQSGAKVTLDTASGLSDTIYSGYQYHVYDWEDVKNIGSPVTYAEKVAATRQYRYQYTSATTISGGEPFENTYKHARNACPIKTWCTNAGNAATLMTHLESLYSVRRKFYTFTYVAEDVLTAINLNLGDEIHLQYEGTDLDLGKDLIITDIEGELLSQTITITAWG